MAKRKPHIVQDERGQDQPTSKRAAHHTETTMPKDANDLDPRDIGSGAHNSVIESVIEEGRLHPDRASPKTTHHQAAELEPGMPPVPDPPDPQSDLPEGLLRPRTGPYGPTKGRA
jgi:hypothetical protein